MKKQEAVALGGIHAAMLDVADKLGELLVHVKQDVLVALPSVTSAGVAAAVRALPNSAPGTPEPALADPEEEQRITKVNDQLEDLGIKFQYGGVIDFDWDKFVEGIGDDNARALRDIIIEKHGV